MSTSHGRTPRLRPSRRGVTRDGPLLLHPLQFSMSRIGRSIFPSSFWFPNFDVDGLFSSTYFSYSGSCNRDESTPGKRVRQRTLVLYLSDGWVR